MGRAGKAGGQKPRAILEGIRALAKLEGDAPGIAQHDEKRAVGLGVLEDERSAGAFKAGALGFGIGGDDGKVENERVLLRVVGHRSAGIGVEFDYRAAGIVGEKMRERSVVAFPRNREAEVGDEPGSVRAGVGNVEGEVFEFQSDGECAMTRTVQAAEAVVNAPGADAADVPVRGRV